jgi:hypothetical protein
MYLSGMKKGTICKNNYLNLDVFNNLLLNYQFHESKKMFVEGKNKNYICKSLKLDKEILNIWILENAFTKNYENYNSAIKNPDEIVSFLDKSLNLK